MPRPRQPGCGGQRWPAYGGDHGCAGIGGGNDVRKLQDSLAQDWVLVYFDVPDGFNDSHHMIDCVHSLFRIGGMAALSLCLHNYLSPAPLANLDRGRGGLADDDEIRLCMSADFTGGYAFKAFLMHGAGYTDIACKILSRVLCILAAAVIMAQTLPFISEVPRP